MSPDFLDTIGLFIFLSGFIIGLGAVIVIDIHGFLGRTSQYWTEATTRTHKVTKPLIWVGIALLTIGASITYRHIPFIGIPLFHFFVTIVLIANGYFLSFKVSPYLLAREREGKQSEILPAVWQRKIAVSLIFSDLGWWSLLAVLVYHLVYLH